MILIDSATIETLQDYHLTPLYHTHTDCNLSMSVCVVIPTLTLSRKELFSSHLFGDTGSPHLAQKMFHVKKCQSFYLPFDGTSSSYRPSLILFFIYF